VLELRQYVDRQGRNRFEKWFNSLAETPRARVTVALDRLERGSEPPAKSVGEGVSELRLDFGPGYRIYFGRDGDTLVILLAGGTKRLQQADIAKAKESWREYKERKREWK
jgi:putative addiction module killer protein